MGSYVVGLKMEENFCYNQFSRKCSAVGKKIGGVTVDRKVCLKKAQGVFPKLLSRLVHFCSLSKKGPFQY